MSEEILSRLQEASDEAQKTWIITETLLNVYPTEVKEAAITAAVPHWFDAAVLAALLQIDSEHLYQEVQTISFTESFGELGYALHDLTRAAILSHLTTAQPDLFSTYSQRAYELFRQSDDPQNVVEAVYHLLATDKAEGMELFRKQMRRYRQERNFSATDNLLRNARELVELGLLADAEAAEIERQEYYTGLTFADLGKSEIAPDKAHDYLAQAIRIFSPTEDIDRYKEVEPDLLRETVSASRQSFLTQKLEEAKQSGDTLRQKIWLTELSSVDWEKEDYETALKHYNDILALDENDKKALALRGETYRRISKYAEALADFDCAIELDENYEWALALRGKTYQQMENYEAALADLDRAIALDESDAWNFAQRGETYRRMGKYLDALADFTLAIRLDENYDWAVAQRGETYGLMGKYREALADFAHAIELDENIAWYFGHRGLSYLLIGQYAEALADFDRAIELDENYTWALASRGETYRLMDKYAEALADFDRAIELDEEYTWAIARRGETYLWMGKYPEALTDFDRVIASRSEEDWYAYDRGLVYSAMNIPDQAQNDFSEAINRASQVYEENPENWRNTFNLATYHLAAGNTEEAERLYRTALAGSVPTHNVREAISDLDDFLRLFPDHQQAQAMRSLVQEYLDKTDKVVLP